jgi:hypothetical protein
MPKTTIPGLDAFVRDLRRAPKEIQREIKQRGKREVAAPAAKAIRTAAVGTYGRATARSVKPGTGLVPVVRGGGATVSTIHGIRSGQLFPGSEFGGGSRVRTYTRRRPKGVGKPHSVTRHTTRQFGPHTGRQGRWFYPAAERQFGSAQFARAWLGIVEDVLGGAFRGR